MVQEKLKIWFILTIVLVLHIGFVRVMSVCVVSVWFVYVGNVLVCVCVHVCVVSVRVMCVSICRVYVMNLSVLCPCIVSSLWFSRLCGSGFVYIDLECITNKQSTKT